MGHRGPGGRASSRKAPSGHVFDHGLQFLLRPGGVGSGEPAVYADAAASGVLAPWRGRLGALALPGGAFTPRGSCSADVASAFFGFAAAAGEVWAGAPTADALAQHLARPREGLTLAARTRVTAVARDAGGGWRLQGVVSGDTPPRPDAPSAPLPGVFAAFVAADASLARMGTPGATSLAAGGQGVPPAVAELAARMAAVPRQPLYSAMALMPRALTEVRSYAWCRDVNRF
jgi:hypothetical protein